MDTVNGWRCGDRPKSWIRPSDGREGMGFLVYTGKFWSTKKKLTFYPIFWSGCPPSPTLLCHHAKNRERNDKMTGVMVCGWVAMVLAAVSLATATTATAAESAQTACFVDTPPSAASTTSANDAAPPHNSYNGPSSALFREDCIQFHLVDTARNATMFRLHHGEVIENYFAKGRAVAIRVDVLAMPYSASGMRLLYNGGSVVVGEELERYVPARPFAFGGVDPVAVPDGGDPSLCLVPLLSLGQYGNHTFTAILVDDDGIDRAQSTITVSVVTEKQQDSYNNGQPQQQLFMDAPEREAFLRRIIRHNGKNRAAAACDGGDDGSSSAIMMMRHQTNRHHRVVPSQRRVRLAGLPVKYFLHRSKRRRSSP
jgi:hypothetical protein